MGNPPAQSHLKRKQWKEGVEEMIKAQSLGFDDRRADIEPEPGPHSHSGDTTRAEKTLSKSPVIGTEERGRLRLFRHVAPESQKRIEEGKKYSEKALAIEPGNTIALGNRISDCIDDILPDEAIQYAKRMLASLPPGDQRVWSAWLSIGWAEEKRGNAAATLAAFKKVTALAPQQSIGWVGVARISSDYAEASDAARKAVELNPNDARRSSDAGKRPGRAWGDPKKRSPHWKRCSSNFPKTVLPPMNWRSYKSIQACSARRSLFLSPT